MGLLPTKILVAVDTAVASEHALDVAHELSDAIGAELHLVHVKVVSSSLRAPRSHVMTPEQRALAEGEAKAVLDRMRERVEQRGGAIADTHVRYGQGIERELVRAQEETGAELLVVPARRAGSLPQRLAGGGSPVTPSGLVRRARGSLLVVHEPQETEPGSP